MPNEEAARQTDPIGHGLGLLGLIGGAVLGAALIVGTGLTGGALAIAVCGAVAAGGLGGEQLVNGIMKAVDWKPQTGTIATGSPNVKIGNLPASRAVLDQSLSCHGLYGLHHFPFFPPTKIAEGAEIVAINGMPAARVDCKLVCGAVINHGQHNVLIGGPTVRLLNVISFDEFLHTFLVNLGLAAYVLSGPVGWTIGELIIKPIFDQLGEWGDDLGPGWRDIFQGGFSLALVIGGSLLTRSRLRPNQSTKLKTTTPRPKISRQKQAGHVKGTPQNKNRIKQGKSTSSFDSWEDAEKYTHEAWDKGKAVPGRPGVRDHDFGQRVGDGPNGGSQRSVRVHQDSKGDIHGHPKGPEF